MQKEIILEKLEKVVNRLKNLEPPKFDEKILAEGSKAISKGVITRDFGIEEWDWPQGVGLYGLNKLQKYKNNNEYDKFLYDWYMRNIEFGLPSKNVNTTAPLLTLVDICDRYEDEVLEELCIKWAEWLMNDLPRTHERGFQHVTTSITDRYGLILNEGQLWIDTLFMMVLFLNKMGVKYEKKEWIDESVYQVLTHIKYLFEKRNGMFHHGWTFEENSNFGEVFWCRGNSWFTFGMMDFIENSGKYLDKGVKKFILSTYKYQVDTLLKYQSSEGGFHTVIDDKESYLEVSGTSGIAAGILKAVRLGILDESYKEKAMKAIDFIVKNVAEDGVVMNVSGGTGIGRDKEHYKNIIIAPMAYGQSLAIVALTEALNHL